MIYSTVCSTLQHLLPVWIPNGKYMNVPYQRMNGESGAFQVNAELGSIAGGSEAEPELKLETLNRGRGRVGTNARSFRAVKVAIGALLFALVLSATVVSKLTLISMTSRLGSALVADVVVTGTAVSLYWQLLFVIMVPQCVTFVRTMLRGVCGKRTSTFPWPTYRALAVVSYIYDIVGDRVNYR